MGRKSAGRSLFKARFLVATVHYEVQQLIGHAVQDLRLVDEASRDEMINGRRASARCSLFVFHPQYQDDLPLESMGKLWGWGWLMG